MGDFDLTSILILAVVAAVIFFRLRSVLGTRTGFEDKPSRDPFKENQDKAREGEPESKGDDSVIAMPDRNKTARADKGPADAAMSEGDSGGPIDHALTQIALADSSFDKEEFLVGARTAFEMVITAFAKGDQKTLRPLLARDVFEDFSGAIKEREANKETLETTFVGIRSAEITDAEMRDRTASVTVTFVSEQINVLKDAEGRILDGDPNAVSTITDVWTFARNTKSRDPNWTLVATDGDQD
ncbi:MAG: Tim44/TimA family putative adaptor protein [Limibacillus sp.]|jgi:predicted lipid-binding transport protein (Tim44 family)